MIKIFMKYTSLTVHSHFGHVLDTSQTIMFFNVTLRYAEISVLFGLATRYFFSNQQLYCKH